MKTLFDGLDNHRDSFQRDYCSGVIFGDLGRGKSTFLKQYAQWYIEKTKAKKVPRRVLIIDPSHAAGFDQFQEISFLDLKFGVQDRVSGKSRRWIGPGIRVVRNEKNWANAQWFEYLNRYFENGLVILDESRVFLPAKRDMHPAATEFFTRHRNRCIDVLVVSHDYMSLHLDLRKAFRYYYNFRTGDKPNDRSWFDTRTLPDELFDSWSLLQKFHCPSAIMQPMVCFDKETKKMALYLHPDTEKEAQIWVNDPTQMHKQKLVPYHTIKTHVKKRKP